MKTIRRSFRSLALGLATTLLAAWTAVEISGQSVMVRAVAEDTSAPVAGALAHLVDMTGRFIDTGLTDDRGRVVFVGVPEGSYRVRIEMIGMRTATVESIRAAPGQGVTRTIRMASRAIELEGLEVEMAGDRCTVRPGREGLLVADLWDEARKALAVAAFTDDQGTYRYEVLRYERALDRETGMVLTEEQSRREGAMPTPFESHPADELMENGFVQDDGAGRVYMAPDAAVLLSDAFLDAHCFRLASSRRGPGGEVGLHFEPTGERRSVPDISGTLWIDPITAHLRWLEYRYEYLEPERSAPEVGGRVDFERLPDGTWIVPEWWIQMPVMARTTDFQGRDRLVIDHFLQSGGRVLDAREVGGARVAGPRGTGTVEGVVVDSLGSPVAGVGVGVVGSSQEVFTNASGAFGITGLTGGRYQIRFVEARLEAMGYEPDTLTRDIVPGESTRIEHRMPSTTKVLLDACPPVESAEGAWREEGSAVLVGRVVDERGRPVESADVQVTWERYHFSGVRQDRRASDLEEVDRAVEGMTGGRGEFVFCGVPQDRRLNLTATLGDAVSELYQVTIAREEVGRVQRVVLRRGG